MNTEEKNQEYYENRIKELETELAETREANDFTDLKNKYEEIIENKNNEIANLKEEVHTTKKKVDDTVDTLNDEIQKRLDANKEYQDALNSLKELEVERAKTTVDNYIKKGIILPSQRETAEKLCLNDNDTFTELYKDAKPIVDVEETKSKRINSLAKGLAYFDRKD